MGGITNRKVIFLFKSIEFLKQKRDLYKLKCLEFSDDYHLNQRQAYYILQKRYSDNVFQNRL